MRHWAWELVVAAACGGGAAQRSLEVAIEPTSASMAVGERQHFKATVIGAADQSVAWSVREAASDVAMLSDGTFIAGATPDTFHVVATSVADPKSYATAVVVVANSNRQDVAVSVEPASVEACGGCIVRFTASVAGTSDQRVRWSASGGTIQQDGTWQAGAEPGEVKITATSIAGSTKCGIATVVVSAPSQISVSIDPPELTIPAGAPKPFQFQARVTGTQDAAVDWSIHEGKGGGLIDSTGLYTANVDEGVFHVVATSHADRTRKATAIVHATPDVSDHGGPVMSSTRTFALWWGDVAAFASDARPALEQFLNGLNGSAHLKVLEQYLFGEKATTVFAGHLLDSSAPPADEPDPSVVVDVACTALVRNGIQPRFGDLVFVSPSNFPTPKSSACGWHYWGNCGDQALAVAYIPNAAKNSFCEHGAYVCANGRSNAARSLVGVADHEFVEAVTDPLVSTWYRSSPLSAYVTEIADMCGYAECINLSTGSFDLQRIYSNATHSCVVE